MTKARIRARSKHLAATCLVAGLFLFLTAAAVSWPDAARAENGFVSGFEDMPMMPDMTEIPDAIVSFDTASGRIVVAFTRIARPSAAIVGFYDGVLAQLGWRRLANARYAREGERLELDFTRDGDATIVRYSLKPE